MCSDFLLDLRWPACVLTSPLFWVDSDLLTVCDWLNTFEPSELKAILLLLRQKKTKAFSATEFYFCAWIWSKVLFLLFDIVQDTAFFFQGQDLRYYS